MKELSGIILAGGKSTRMGKDKGLVQFKGKPLVEYAIEVLNPFCNEILISANALHYNRFGYELIVDSFDSKGPLCGIYEGLKAALNKHVLVISCDMPFINQEAVFNLLKGFDGKHDCYVPMYNNRIQPLFGIYNKRLLAQIEFNLVNDKLKMMTFIENISTKKVSFDRLVERFPKLFSNFNLPIDLT